MEQCYIQYAQFIWYMYAIEYNSPPIYTQTALTLRATIHFNRSSNYRFQYYQLNNSLNQF